MAGNVFGYIFWITILANQTASLKLVRFRGRRLIQEIHLKYSQVSLKSLKKLSERTHSCPFYGLVLD